MSVERAGAACLACPRQPPSAGPRRRRPSPSSAAARVLRHDGRRVRRRRRPPRRRLRAGRRPRDRRGRSPAPDPLRARQRAVAPERRPARRGAASISCGPSPPPCAGRATAPAGSSTRRAPPRSRRPATATHFDPARVERLRRDRPASPLPGEWRLVGVRGDEVVRPAGVRLDSGGLGKGLAADRMAAALGALRLVAVDCAGDLASAAAAGLPRPVDIDRPVRRRARRAPLPPRPRCRGDERRDPPALGRRPPPRRPADGRAGRHGIVQVTALADRASWPRSAPRRRCSPGPTTRAEHLPRRRAVRDRRRPAPPGGAMTATTTSSGSRAAPRASPRCCCQPRRVALGLPMGGRLIAAACARPALAARVALAGDARRARRPRLLAARRHSCARRSPTSRSRSLRLPPLWTAAGIVGGWALVLLGLSYYAAARSARPLAQPAPLHRAGLAAGHRPLARRGQRRRARVVPGHGRARRRAAGAAGGAHDPRRPSPPPPAPPRRSNEGAHPCPRAHLHLLPA